MSRVLLLSIICSTCALVGSLTDVIKLYVNRVLVQEADVSISANVSHIVNFTYEEGDPVEVSCIRLTRICKLKLSFDFFDEDIGGNDSITESKDVDTEHKNGVGLRTTLQSKHNEARVVCGCVGLEHQYQYSSTVTVTFVLSNYHESMVNLKIDGYIVRQQYEPTSTSMQVYCACDETLRVEWQATTESVELEAYLFAAQSSPKEAIRDKRLDITKCLHIHRVLIQYATRDNVTARHTMEIYFDKYFIATPDHRAPLVVNTSHSLLQLYDFNGRQVIYYDYGENETVTISCGIPANIVTNANYLIFGDTVERNNRSIVKQFSLSAMDDNKSVECHMLRNFNNKTAKHTRLVWRHTHTPPAHTHATAEQWMVAAMAGSGLVVLACVAVWCARRRKLLRAVQYENSEEKLCDDAIPSYPPQWTSQSAPTSQAREEPTYSEVIPSASRTCAREAALGSIYQNTTTEPSVIYAVLDLPTSSRDPKPVHTEDSPYAEVLQMNISE